MKIGTISRALKLSIAITTVAAFLISSGITFAGGVSPGQGGSNILPAPPKATKGGRNGGGNNIDAARTWLNTNVGATDYNTGTNWVGGAAPGVGDVGLFTAAQVSQPNLSSPLSNSGLFFNAPGVNGYDITSTGGAAFTLTGQSTSGSSGASDSSAAAIRGSNTSGTNTIDAPLILGSTTGTSTFFQAAGGTLIVNGTIGETGGAKALSLRGGGTIQLNGPNTFSGGTSTDVAANQVLVIGDNNALGTGAFSVNISTTIQAGGGARTIANPTTLNGTATIGGANAFTFNGSVTAAGAVTRTLTVNNSALTTLAGSVFLSDLAGTGRTLVINGSGATTISGVVADFNGAGSAGSLRYSGTSTLTLGNTNTYSGGTSITVAGGQILATATGAFGSGNISLITAPAVTLTLQGLSTNYIGDTANLSIVLGNTINLNFTGTDAIGELIVDGIVQPLGLYGAGAGGTNADGDFFGTGLLLVTVVPERSTWSMLVMGAALLLGVQRWRRRRTS